MEWEVEGHNFPTHQVFLYDAPGPYSIVTLTHVKDIV